MGIFKKLKKLVKPALAIGGSFFGIPPGVTNGITGGGGFEDILGGLASSVLGGIATSKKNKREQGNALEQLALQATAGGEEARATSIFSKLADEALVQRVRIRKDKGLNNFRQFSNEEFKNIRKAAPEDIPLPDLKNFSRSGLPKFGG